jgi:hypothetical protein
MARFQGTSRLHNSGAIYEEVWSRLSQPEKDRGPDKKGFAMLIDVERAEELDGPPLVSIEIEIVSRAYRVPPWLRPISAISNGEWR